MIRLIWLAMATVWVAGADAPAIAPVVQPDPVRVNAWEVLRKGLADKSVENRMAAIRALASLCTQPQAVALVQHGLHDENSRVRRSAAEGLGAMNARQAIPQLKQALQDDDEVSFAAARALWALGDFSGREVFEGILTGKRRDGPGFAQGFIRDAKRQLRNPAQLALLAVDNVSGAFLGPGAFGITMAESALRDNGAPGRITAVEFLARDPQPYALTLLEWALEDGNATVRAAVCKALGQRGNHQTIAKLEPLFRDKPAVRYMAAASVIRLSDGAAQGPASLATANSCGIDKSVLAPEALPGPPPGQTMFRQNRGF